MYFKTVMTPSGETHHNVPQVSIEHFWNDVKKGEEVYTRTFSNRIKQYQTVLKLENISNFD